MVDIKNVIINLSDNRIVKLEPRFISSAPIQTRGTQRVAGRKSRKLHPALTTRAGGMVG